ncbi:protein of unknown function [Cupriavidus taiwanensis]|nr:protein of unknown function [Cupriavidus taiwanensis]
MEQLYGNRLRLAKKLNRVRIY